MLTQFWSKIGFAGNAVAALKIEPISFQQKTEDKRSFKLSLIFEIMEILKKGEPKQPENDFYQVFKEHFWIFKTTEYVWKSTIWYICVLNLQ